MWVIRVLNFTIKNKLGSILKKIKIKKIVFLSIDLVQISVSLKNIKI